MEQKHVAAKLNKHIAALGAAAAAVTGVGVVQQNAEAALVHSGVINLNVPSTTAGVYLNLVTGVSNTAPASAPGWDLNPWSSTAFNVWTNNAANPANSDGTIIAFPGGNSATLTDNLPLGTLIDGTGPFGRTASSETAGLTAFNLNSSNNLVGFRFFNESTSAVNFGWARFALAGTTGGQPRTLVEYAYDNTGLPVLAGIIPEPTSLGLLAVGAMGLALRRRTA
jgi:hypothetical protein